MPTPDEEIDAIIFNKYFKPFSPDIVDLAQSMDYYIVFDEDGNERLLNLDGGELEWDEN